MASVPRDDLKTGDLVFFGPNRKQVNHVGMYLSGGHFLHAARSEGVTISRLDDSYWKSRFMFSKRMRGLVLGEDDADEGLDFRQGFMQDSYRLAFDNRYDTDVSLLDFGIKVNDSIEFLLSGFFLSSLANQAPAADMAPPSSSLNSIESASEGGGFRLSALFSPSEWIKLVPSVTQVDPEFDVAKLRYHRVIIMTDADVDGEHIRTLLLTFFFRHLRKIVDDGHLFIAQPPLYKVKKGKAERYLKDDRGMVEFLIENGAESLSVEAAGNGGAWTGQRLSACLKKGVAWQHCLHTLEKRGQNPHVVAALLQQGGVPRGTLKDEAKATRLLDRLLARLRQGLRTPWRRRGARRVG